MKKQTSLILLLILVLNCFTLETCCANEQTWIESTDGVFETMMSSIDTSNYPSVDVLLRYRIDVNMEGNGIWSFDLSHTINSYITKHPEYKNRKIKDITGKISYIKTIREGLEYSIQIILTVGGEENAECGCLINLWREFPDDFIDYDAFHIAEGLKIYQTSLAKPDSLEITGNIEKRRDLSNEKIVYYSVPTSAMNSSGGFSKADIGIVYNEENGKIDIYYLTGNGAGLGSEKRAHYEGANPNIRFFHNGLSLIGGFYEDTLECTIHQRYVIEAMN